ncbi:MAG: bacterial proteasome activator family protein [Actinomycetes bacterium]
MSDSHSSYPDDQRLIIIGADGKRPAAATREPAETNLPAGIAQMVEQPAKVMRIGSMIKQLLDEVRSAPLDEAARARLRDIHRRSIVELEEGLAPELVAELERLSLPFEDNRVPSDSELRIAQAQLVGWLEGLFHGIQTALIAQQMSAQNQVEQMRRGAIGPNSQDQDAPSAPGVFPPVDSATGSGLYL